MTHNQMARAMERYVNRWVPRLDLQAWEIKLLRDDVIWDRDGESMSIDTHPDYNRAVLFWCERAFSSTSHHPLHADGKFAWGSPEYQVVHELGHLVGCQVATVEALAAVILDEATRPDVAKLLRTQATHADENLAEAIARMMIRAYGEKP